MIRSGWLSLVLTIGMDSILSRVFGTIEKPTKRDVELDVLFAPYGQWAYFNKHRWGAVLVETPQFGVGTSEFGAAST